MLAITIVTSIENGQIVRPRRQGETTSLGGVIGLDYVSRFAIGSDSARLEWIDEPIAYALNHKLNDYVKFTSNERALSEFRALQIVSFKSGYSGKGFQLTSDFPALMSLVMSPYSPTVINDLESLAKEGNQWIKTMAEDLDYWGNEPAIPSVYYLEEPDISHTANVLKLILPTSRLLLFRMLGFGACVPMDAAYAPIRSLGFDKAITMNELIVNELIAPALPEQVYLSRSKSALIKMARTHEIKGRSKMSQSELAASLFEVAPEEAKEIAVRDRLY